MGFSLKSIGKSISKAVSNIGKAVSKAAPVLIPLALTAATGGAGGGLLKGLSLGKVGNSLVSGLLGNVVKSGPASEKGGGNDILGGIISKVAPTLLTRAIEGKPKNAQQEAAALYQNSPLTQFNAQNAGIYSQAIKNSMAPQPIISPSSTASKSSMVYGNKLFQDQPAAQSSLAAAPSLSGAPANSAAAPQTLKFQDPMAPVAPTGGFAGPQIGSPAAPINFNFGNKTEDEDIQRRARGYAIRGRAA